MVSISNITGALTTVLVIGILVFFHELGHFLFAKLFRMKVEDFSIGFGPRMVRLYFDGQTEYNLRWLPVGGFVRIAGMEIEDDAERRLTAAHDRRDGFSTTNGETMSQEAAEVSGADPDGFNSRPIYQRFFVIAGGPAFSFLLGWLSLCLMGVLFGIPVSQQVTTKIDQVSSGTPAARAGLHANDTVVSLNGQTLKSGEDMIKILRSSPNKPVAVVVRDSSGATRSIDITPEAKPNPDPNAEPKIIGQIGIAPAIVDGPSKRVSLSESFQEGNAMTVMWFHLIGNLFQKPAELKNSIGGPIKTVQMTFKATQKGNTEVMSLLGQLSLSLGLFNLLPIPILDGGHLALMGLEAIRRRKLTAGQTGQVFMVGLAVMAILFVAVMFKDVAGSFHH